MIREKNIAVCIILTFITCGLYGIYWLICMAEDLNRLTLDTSVSGGMVFLFSILTCGIYLLFWNYKAGERLDNINKQRGLGISNQAIIYLLLSIFGLSIVSYALIQSELNNYATPL